MGDTTSDDAITKRVSETSKWSHPLIYGIDIFEVILVCIALSVALSARWGMQNNVLSDNLKKIFKDITIYGGLLAILAVGVPMILIFVVELGNRNDGLIDGDQS